jgi:putative spermidine/putrescine transport system permease protein
MADALQPGTLSADIPTTVVGTPQEQKKPQLPVSWNWLGVLPFLAFVIAFQLFPTFSIIVRALTDSSGNFTLENIRALNDPVVIGSFWSTIRLSFFTAVGGGILGLLLAYAITIGGLPSWIRNGILTFSGVASNFAGVPLAFAFIATLGVTGIVTRWLKSIGISLYPSFSIYSFWGLVITYIYFQIPLMVLIMAPALSGLRREWREASENLGATPLQYWRFIGLPILLPPILGTMALLFSNAFGAQATAFALVGGGAGANLVVSLLVASQSGGDVIANVGLGNSLVFGMIIIIGITIGIYAYFRRRSERWLIR